MKYAICHNPHSFDQCPILNRVSYIKQHFISYCLLTNKAQKQILAAMHRIDATWDTDINNNDDDNDGENTYYLHRNIDNHPDFQ